MPQLSPVPKLSPVLPGPPPSHGRAYQKAPVLIRGPVVGSGAQQLPCVWHGLGAPLRPAWCLVTSAPVFLGYKS